ncbi:DUF3099 domain-containing protein [Pseudonocardia sp. EC080625-04]|uniref:DUF3099 domain-containing protein n=2 Tax=Pseudonocardia TaxID=1847 RepID=UPI0039C90453
MAAAHRCGRAVLLCGCHHGTGGGRVSDQRREESVLITDAQMSYEEELEIRKRRYKLTMGLRIPCMILAGICYQIPWLAVTLLAISVPLPWIAVLVANDRLPRKAEKPNRYRREHRAIEARPHQVIDSSEQEADGAGPSGGTTGRDAGATPHGDDAAGARTGTDGPGDGTGRAEPDDRAGAADGRDRSG